MCAIYSFFVTASYLPLADTAVPSFIAPLVTTAVAATVGSTPRVQTLDPKPRTPVLNPQTLHHKPYFRYPKPCTLHPKP